MPASSIPLKAIPASATTIYVDSVLGSDASANPTNSATPYATLDAALLAVAGLRMQDLQQDIDISVVGSTVAARSYALADTDLARFANHVRFIATDKVVAYSGTISAITAAATATGGLTVDVSGAPGWVAGVSMRLHLLSNTTLGQIRPTAGAIGAATVRLGGANTSKVEPAVPTNWVAGNAISIYQPGVIIDLTGWPSLDDIYLRFSGVQVGVLGNTVNVNTGTHLGMDECLVLAAFNIGCGSRARVVSCILANSTGGSAAPNGNWINFGTVWDALNGGSLNFQANSALNISGNTVIAGEYGFKYGDAVVISDPNASPTVVACVFYQDAKPIVPASTSVGFGAHIGALRWLGKLSAAAGDYYIAPQEGAIVVLTGLDAVTNSAGATALAYAGASSLLRAKVTTPATLTGAGMGATTETAYADAVLIPVILGVVGRSIRWSVKFYVDNDNAADTWRIRARLGAAGVGGVVIADSTAFNIAAGKMVYIEGTINITAVGAGGTFDAFALVCNESPAVQTGTFVSAGAIDTTVTRYLTLTAECSTASANDSVTRRFFEVEVWP